MTEIKASQPETPADLADESTDKDHLLSNDVYDGLKFVALVLLPAMGTLYSALDALWRFGYALQVVGSLSAVDAFLGALLHVSTSSYNASTAKYVGAVNISVNPENGKKLYSLDLNGDPEDLDGQSEVVFKINNQT